jgi:SAM-dependent methyltransferase
VRDGQSFRPRGAGGTGLMLGNLYDRALDGERCWIRRDDGEISNLPVRRWLGGRDADCQFDDAVVGLCSGPTIDLGCGPGRLVTELIRRGVPALGVDQSATAVGLARRRGAPVLRRDVFDALPATGRWQTVLLADGNVGLGGDPLRVLRRSAELLSRGGRCIAEFEPVATGIRTGWVRLESSRAIGPWFRWASVGIDCAAELADEAGLALTAMHPIGRRVLASLALA